jgi:transcriptional regulator of acetoin/glycerol metabolism
MSEADALDRVRALARTCANRGLRLDQARYMLDAMMISDALAIEGGCVMAAADRLGIDRTAIHRRIKKSGLQQK